MTSGRPVLKIALIASALLALLVLQRGGGEDVVPTDGPVEIVMSAVDLYTPPRPERDRRIGKLRFLTGHELTAGARDFGGFSALALAPDGRRAIALSDGAQWLDLEFALEADLPARIERAHMAPLRDGEGRLLEGDDRDSESLVMLEEGALIGFEHRHRVDFYAAADPWAFPSQVKYAPAQPLALPPEVLDHPRNGGIEAAVRLADGRLLLFSERAQAGGGALRAWLVSAGMSSAQALAYMPPEAGFHATDAALLPDGDVLLLLRRFSPLQGVAASLLRVPAEDVAGGAVLAGEELARLAPPLTVDNMEGLAVRVDAAGRTRIHMISDDNFNPLQRTLYLVFELVEDER